MTDIEWSKAPDGTTHARGDDPLRPWRKKGNGCWFAWCPERQDWMLAINILAEEKYIKREWSGEGLPPVGTLCEMLSHGEEESEWIEVQILAHTKIYGEDHAVFQYEDHVGTSDNRGVCFRPIQSDEERALELVLSEIEALYAEGGPAAIYDAGYRKVEGGAE